MDNDHKKTALTSAADMGNLEMVKYLVEEQGADVNKGNGDRTPLIRATWNNLEIVKYLVEQGANISNLSCDL
jgi:ankyrin repeat protein